MLPSLNNDDDDDGDDDDDDDDDDYYYYYYCDKTWNKSLSVSYSKWLYILFPGQKTYYHYTDKKGAEGIAKSKEIKASTDTKNDAVFGRGK